MPWDTTCRRCRVRMTWDWTVSEAHSAMAVGTDTDPAPPQRILLTADEVAEMVGMGVDWIYEQSRRGLIPTVKLGRYRRYRREAIEEWLRSLED